MSARQKPGSRAEYRQLLPIQTRWTDNDLYGHANNTVYYLWFDTAVNSLMIGPDGLDPFHGPVLDFIVESGCCYHRGVRFPDALEVGIRIRRLGTSSIHWECAVFGPDDELAAAEGFIVHVMVDRESQRPVALPATLRAKLAPLVVPD